MSDLNQNNKRKLDCTETKNQNNQTEIQGFRFTNNSTKIILEQNNAEHTEDYSEDFNSDTVGKPSSVRLTNAEKMRNYRARKKLKTDKKLPLNSTKRSRINRAKYRINELQNDQEGIEKSSIVEKSLEYYEKNESDSNDDLSVDDNCSINDDNDNNTSDDLSDFRESNLYPDYCRSKEAHKHFRLQFINNSFGHTCSVCDRLWFKRDLKTPSSQYQHLINEILPNILINNILLCGTCRASLCKNQIPIMAVYNGFKYPEMPNDLPPLDPISERLISPRIPFMTIRRLRHCNGQFGIYGQIINVPVSVDTMVNSLPRNLDDDYAINVHLKRQITHKSSYLFGLVKKRTIKTWLNFLIPSPLYSNYNITVNRTFFNDDERNSFNLNDVSEHIPIEESLYAQQETLMWNEDEYLCLAPGQMKTPISLLFDDHAEELSFPAIYLGQFRNFRENVRVTPFNIASSELRRSDRRGVTPRHLLYMAMKIMRLRIRDSLTIAFKYVGKDTIITKKTNPK